MSPKAGLSLDWPPFPNRWNEEVMRIYRNAPMRKPCACGGEIEALPWTIKESVQRHQRTDLHRAWREREFPSSDES